MMQANAWGAGAAVLIGCVPAAALLAMKTLDGAELGGEASRIHAAAFGARHLPNPQHAAVSA
jgi:hypothetical protein